MPVRSAHRTVAALATAVKQTGRVRPTRLPSKVLHDDDAGLWLALLVPGATWLGFTPTGGSEQTWLFAADGSWATVDDQAGQVEQHGPRMLWDEIESAHDRWRAAGSPQRDRLGLTVTGNGKHRCWLDIPDSDHTVARLDDQAFER